MEKRNISYQQMHGHCLEIARLMMVDKWKPDLIIGITRGGALPALLLSHFFGAKMIGMDVSLRDNYGGDYGHESNCWAAEDAMEGKKILIVDDINDTGATINWIMQDWDHPSGSIKWGDNVRFAVIVDNEASDALHVPDYCGETINKVAKDEWIVFPYEDWWKCL
jgi:hypoxanthine phosphoribosyltransferase